MRFAELPLSEVERHVHTEPKNDEWREVHLAQVENLGDRLRLRYNSYAHRIAPQNNPLY